MEIVLIVALCALGVVLLAYGLRPQRVLRLPRDDEAEFGDWDGIDGDSHADAGGMVIDLDAETPGERGRVAPPPDAKRPPAMPGA